jgi:predicted TIM-barrel fold metal-dependent hydrolase
MQEKITPQAVSLHPAASEEWLSLVREEAIDPHRAIVDSHLHLFGAPRVPYSHDHFLADARSGHRIVGTVYTECTEAYRQTGPEELRSVGETETVAKLAQAVAVPGTPAEGFYGAIVGFADLQLGARVREVLEAHVEAGRGRFRGIRQSSAWDPHPEVKSTIRTPPPHMLAQGSFREGFKVLQGMGLVFDAWCYFHQLDELAELANAFPDAPIVVNHAGGPVGIGPYASRRTQVFNEWSAAIRRLARLPNVSVKLGGLGMRLFGGEFHTRPQPPGSEELARAWRPFIETCIEAFGPQRAMFESNFPVDRGTCSYAVLWNTFKRVTAEYSDSEKEALFSRTAARAYGLRLPGIAGT